MSFSLTWTFVLLIFSFSAYSSAAHNLAINPPCWLFMYVCNNYWCSLPLHQELTAAYFTHTHLHPFFCEHMGLSVFSVLLFMSGEWDLVTLWLLQYCFSLILNFSFPLLICLLHNLAVNPASSLCSIYVCNKSWRSPPLPPLLMVNLRMDMGCLVITLYLLL